MEEYKYKIITVKKEKKINSESYNSDEKKIKQVFALKSLVDIDILSDIENLHRDIIKRGTGLEKVVTIIE